MYKRTSADTRYFGSGNEGKLILFTYGSACKTLIHGEVRGSKFDDAAVAAVYTGVAHNSDSYLYCSVWNGDNYIDVDVGCTDVNERKVIERTLRTHP